MIDGTYSITLHTPQGSNTGYIVLATSDCNVTTDITIDGIGSVRKTGTHSGDEFAIAGSLNLFLIGRVNYKINGLVAGNMIKATCSTERGTFDITGSRV